MKDSNDTKGNPNPIGKSSDSKEDSKMPDRENDENFVDPPENQGGGGKAEEMDLDGTEGGSRAVDPPSNDGGN